MNRGHCNDCGGRPCRLPEIGFQQHLKNVVADPTRSDEFKSLVELFGMAYLEKVLAGEAIFKPEYLYKKVSGK